MPFDGPKFADALGNVQFELSDITSGCHDIEVTVSDIGQSASDTGAFVAYATLEKLNAYQWWVDEDGDGWDRHERYCLGDLKMRCGSI